MAKQNCTKMHKEVYKAYLKTGSDIKVLINPMDYDCLSISNKRKAIVYNLNAKMGAQVVTAVKFICKIGAEMTDSIMKI